MPPTGTVAFLFTDIEGSTRLATARPDEYTTMLDQHRQIIRSAIDRHRGHEVGTEGDSFFVTFGSPLAAVQAAAEAQRELTSSGLVTAGLRVRMGLHVGEAVEHDGGYVGAEVHRAARVSAIGHGGQVLVSNAMAAVIGDRLPEGLGLRDLGEFRLKDFGTPTRVYQLTAHGLADSFPPLRAAGPDLTNLPQQLTSFVGRASEIAELGMLARSNRLLSLIGTGGTGKTRLMLRLAEDIDRPADGTWLVELASVRDGDVVAGEIARVLGLRQESGRAMSDTLVDFLRSKDMLLLLDNCEQVVAAAAATTELLLTRCPQLRLLATSREPLDIAGETIFTVPPLSVSPAVGSDASTSDAAQLFVDRARAVLPSFELDARSEPSVTAICTRLDGIPLALELAAARVSLLSVEEIAEGLEHRLRLLDSGRRTAVPRQQTLRALIDWSWDLLDEADRRLLRRLSVFSGGWTLKAASAVSAVNDASEIRYGLGRLVARSLVVVERGPESRYRLLETIREYAREQLDSAGEAVDARDRHLDHFLAIAEQAAIDVKGPHMAESLVRLEAEIDNFRSALDWAFEMRAEDALRMCVALVWYWRSAVVDEAVGRLGRAVDLIASLPPPQAGGEDERARLVARVLATAANAQAGSGARGSAVDWADRAVALARTTSDSAALLDSLSAHALALVWSNEPSGAMADLVESVLLAESVGDWWTAGMARATIAQGAFLTGDAVNADAELVKADEAAERSGNPFVIAFVAFIRGRVSGALGNFAEASSSLQKAMSAYEALGDRRFSLIARSELAHVVRHSGLLEQSRQLYAETLAGWQHMGNRGAIANQLECFAYLALARDDLPRAAQLLGAAALMREEGASPMMPYEQPEYVAALDDLRVRLGPAMASAWADGRALTTDQAVALALSG